MAVQIDSQQLINDYLDSVYTISHSSSSVRVYGLGIRHFQEFLQTKHQISLDELIIKFKNEEVDPYQIINEFVIYLDKLGKKPASIKIWITGLKGFLRKCGVKIYTEDFRAIVKMPKKLKFREEPLTKEIILRVLNNVSPKLRTIILVAVASGMRIGEIVQFKLSDVDFDSKPTRIRIRAEITKTRESRETFLTSEATKSLKDYLTRYCDVGEDFIFGWKHKRKPRNNNPRETPLQSTEAILINSLKRHLRNIPELSKVNENGIHMIHFHAFRKYFRTVVGNVVGRDYAEALMGHHFYLDTYYNLPDDKKREMYLEAEPSLTIANYVSIEKDLISVKKKQEEIESKYLDLIKLLKEEHVDFPKILEKYLK